MGFRGAGGGSPMQSVAPLTKVVKILLISNVAIWLIGQVIIEGVILSHSRAYVTLFLGLSPRSLLENYYLWQIVTYMFVHALDPMHILFNMLLLWWLGGELELLWGSRFFAAYYFVCGTGAALFYTLAVVIYAMVSGNMGVLDAPVVGASGAIFGLLTAYGIFFGERVVQFMFLFPMKAKHFVLILAAIEFVILLTKGLTESQVANLAHLGGFVVGFLFLFFMARLKKTKRTSKPKGGRKLTIVVKDDEPKDPKHWN